jgi:hemerythrin
LWRLPVAIQWTKDLAVGVQIIDEQHQMLFKKINDLLEACNLRRGKDKVGEVLDFLGSYVVDHFHAEEDVMALRKYPDAALHRKQHQEFLATFADIKREFDADGSGPHIVARTNQAVVAWLNSHIRAVDKKLGVFLNMGEAAGAQREQSR